MRRTRSRFMSGATLASADAGTRSRPFGLAVHGQKDHSAGALAQSVDVTEQHHIRWRLCIIPGFVRPNRPRFAFSALLVGGVDGLFYT